MKFAEINKRYTEIVSEYLVKGYTINTASMAGSQGEIAKIDFTDGKDIIRIEIRDFHNWENYTDGVEIVIGRCTDNVRPHTEKEMTVWSSRLEIIYTERFYSIDGRSGKYYCTKEEAERAMEVRCERRSNRHNSRSKYEPNEKAMEIAKRIARDKLGYKRIIVDNLKLLKDKEGYRVVYNGKSYRLH